MKNISFGINALLFVLLTFGASAQRAADNQSANSNKKQEVQFPSASQFADSKLSFKIIPAANKTWCYDILADGKMIIHQPSAPGLPGNEGFKTKAAAKKIAEIVIGKIQNGEMPPTVSKEEMQKIGAL